MIFNFVGKTGGLIRAQMKHSDIRIMQPKSIFESWQFSLLTNHECHDLPEHLKIIHVYEAKFYADLKNTNKLPLPNRENAHVVRIQSSVKPETYR